MKCSNCGKQTSFIGKFCHWCNNDKSKDQKANCVIVIISILIVVIIWTWF
jgi:hypothetical protein